MSLDNETLSELKAILKKISKSPEEVKKHLLNAGIIDKNGKFTKHYKTLEEHFEIRG